MKSLKNLAYLTAGFAYALIVLGAVVRITESGMGCGDHWPLCNDRLIPVFTDYTVVIEYAHRLAAVGLLILIFALAGTAFAKRSLPGVSGRGGVLRPAMLSLGLFFLPAVLGAITVKLELHAGAVVLHLGAAMGLLTSLLVAGWRAEGPGSSVLGRESVPRPIAQDPRPTGRTKRAAITALVLAGTAILLGGLTATTGASTACQGFPLCNGRFWPESGTGGLAHLHWMHRLIAYALFGHLIGLAMGARRRGAATAVQSWAWISVTLVTLQVVVAAVMVLGNLPPVWRGLHQAVGAAVWIAVAGVLWRVLAQRVPGASSAGRS